MVLNIKLKMVMKNIDFPCAWNPRHFFQDSHVRTGHLATMFLHSSDITTYQSNALYNVDSAEDSSILVLCLISL